MQLTVHDIAALLQVSERTVYRWIQQKTIPFYKVLDQYRFNRAEILEWATAQRMSVSPEIFREPETRNIPLPSMSEALKKGGIHYHIQGKDKASVMRSVVESISVSKESDRPLLLEVLLAREELASTGIGEGIAIPHPRSPIIINIEEPMIALCFLDTPVEFEALDKKPVHCLFTLVTPTVRAHLHLLSRIAYALHDPVFKQVIQTHGLREDIIREAKRAEDMVED